jgi:histidyl-tRNA synthetase
VVVIVGSDELQAGTLTLRDTRQRREETMSKPDALARLKALYGR